MSARTQSNLVPLALGLGTFVGAIVLVEILIRGGVYAANRLSTENASTRAVNPAPAPNPNRDHDAV